MYSNNIKMISEFNKNIYFLRAVYRSQEEIMLTCDRHVRHALELHDCRLENPTVHSGPPVSDVRA